MHYWWAAMPESATRRADEAVFQHVLDPCVSGTNKVASVWREFQDGDLGFKAHPRFSSLGEIFRHQLLSERRFFGEFLETPEPAPEQVLPAPFMVESAIDRLVELAKVRQEFFAQREAAWWMEVMLFFDVKRQRIWILWPRVLHTSHHCTQLTVVLRPLDRNVPATYGPTADVTGTGADPSHSVEAAGRSRRSSRR